MRPPRRFEEVGADAGLEVVGFEYGLGALFSDLDRDGDLDLYVANDTKPNRLYDNVPWPGRRRGRPRRDRLPLRGARRQGRRRGSERRDGRRRGRLRRRRVPGPVRDQRPRTGPRRVPRPGVRAREPLVRRRAGGSRGPPHRLGGLGRLVGRPRPRHGSRPLPRERRRSGDGPPGRRAIGPGVRQPHGAGDAGRFEDLGDMVGMRELGPLLGRGSAAADYDNDGDLDLAINSIGGDLVLLESSGALGNWLEVGIDGFAPGTLLTAVLPDGRELVREIFAGSSYLSSEDPRAHFGLGTAGTLTELVVTLARRPGDGPRRCRGQPDRQPWSRPDEAVDLASRVLVAATTLPPAPPRRTTTGWTTARRQTVRAARWRVSGTTLSSMRSGATCRPRPCTHGTCSTPRRRCGMRGPRTTRWPRGTSWTRSCRRRT